MVTAAPYIQRGGLNGRCCHQSLWWTGCHWSFCMSVAESAFPLAETQSQKENLNSRFISLSKWTHAARMLLYSCYCRESWTLSICSAKWSAEANLFGDKSSLCDEMWCLFSSVQDYKEPEKFAGLYTCSLYYWTGTVLPSVDALAFTVGVSLAGFLQQPNSSGVDDDGVKNKDTPSQNVLVNFIWPHNTTQDNFDL